MSLSLIRKPFIVQGLAFTIAVLMMNNVQAANEQEQIQQLRDEVKELRALLEQYVPQSKQKNEMPQQATQTSVAAQNQNMPKHTEASPQPSALSFNSASGAQVQLYGFYAAMHRIKPKAAMAFSTESIKLILREMKKIVIVFIALRR